MLPKHQNVKYIDIGLGNLFGMVDIIGSAFRHDEMEPGSWFLHKERLKRQFTIMSDAYSEFMSLSILDLYRLQIEFVEYYDSMEAQ